MYKDMNEEIVKEMNKKLEELKELRKTNPELAKKLAKESLQKSGIIDENGELLPPYNGQKVHDTDFTRGPKQTIELDEDER